LPFQCMRFEDSWQPVQASFCTLAGDARPFQPNIRSGFGRSFASAGLLMWESLSPWQLVQVGVRPSARTPWRVCAMASTGYSSPWSWQRVHFASPRSTRSFGASRCADASPAASKRNPAIAATACRSLRVATMATRFALELDLHRARPLGLGMCDPVVAIDAGPAFGLALGMARARLLGLHLRVHLVGV